MHGMGVHFSLARPSITIELPIRASACETEPSGPSILNVTSAPKARSRNASSAATSGTTRYGVTVWYPSGIGLTAIVASCAVAMLSRKRRGRRGRAVGVADHDRHARPGGQRVV